MNYRKSKFQARRDFLARGGVVVAGIAGSCIPVEGLTATSSSPTLTGNIQKDIANLLSAADAAALRQLAATALSDPAWPALAASTLQTTIGLTSFQASLLMAIGDMTRDPAVISGLLLGGTAQRIQANSIARMRITVLANPAIRKLLYTAKNLRGSKNAGLLSNYVAKAVANLSMTLRPPTTLGSPTLDSVTKDIANLRLSAVYTKLAAGLIPILQEPNFIPYLRAQRASIIATFIPADVVLGLLLPSDLDPPLSDATRGIIEVLVTLASTILAIVLLPEELALGALLGVLALIYGIEVGGLILGFDDIFKGIDCDFDGDPSDPDDVPGLEC
jgi:hypothetical protein